MDTVFRRSIVAVATDGAVHAGIEDDFHHYELIVRHDGIRVTAVHARSFRTPFTTCPAAEHRLADLVGHAIDTRPTGLPDPHHQCTHMFELATVALAQAVRGGQRRYDIAVPHRALGGTTCATLHRNGALILRLAIDGDVIAAPSPYAGSNLRTIIGWAAENLDDEAFEAIKVLRRGIHVSTGRSAVVEHIERASDIPQVAGACYVFQPVRSADALRSQGSQRDFTSSSSGPLASFPMMPEDADS